MDSLKPNFIQGVALFFECSSKYQYKSRDGSRTAVTSKMEHFVIIVNGWKPLTIITKRSILDFAAVQDPPLQSIKVSNMSRSPSVMNMVITGSLGMYILHIFKIT